MSSAADQPIRAPTTVRGCKPGVIAASWILAYATKVLLTADKMRTHAGSADCEYAFEMELSAFSQNAREEQVQVMGFQGHSSIDGRVGDPLREINQVLSALVTDLYDATGSGQPQPISIQVDLA